MDGEKTHLDIRVFVRPWWYRRRTSKQTYFNHRAAYFRRRAPVSTTLLQQQTFQLDLEPVLIVESSEKIEVFILSNHFVYSFSTIRRNDRNVTGTRRTYVMYTSWVFGW